LRIKFNLGGGADGSRSTMAAKMEKHSFAENDWTQVGNLLAARTTHRSSVVGNNIFHIGRYPGAE